jgi:hypothetical protein
VYVDDKHCVWRDVVAVMYLHEPSRQCTSIHNTLRHHPTIMYGVMLSLSCTCMNHRHKNTFVVPAKKQRKLHRLMGTRELTSMVPTKCVGCSRFKHFPTFVIPDTKLQSQGIVPCNTEFVSENVPDGYLRPSDTFSGTNYLLFLFLMLLLLVVHPMSMTKWARMSLVGVVCRY